MKHQEPRDTGDQLRSPENKLEKATLGGGCFWCLEAPFEQLEGVVEVISGYAGGHTPDPTYREVGTGTTGHAEVVRVEFDPAILPFRDLLRVFFSMHDPTTPDRQGVDIGPEYRSIILFHSESQREIAEQVIEELDADDIWDDPIVTEIAPLTTFYPAEDYHQEYYRRNSGAGYCRMVIDPKMEKLRKEFSSRLKKVPVQ
ncbi:MAG: peptide-methionine (S)-S-oxide reductase [Sphaerobacteraceae bacterium]|nr:MAG: peptide-methionine (S)-S-oxide reductase [Sphaerobacteraceae bacterium]